MQFQFWYSLVLLLTMTVTLVRARGNTHIVVFSFLMLFVVGGVISVDEAFKGFSNSAMLTVAFLFVITAALESTGVIFKATSFFFGKKELPISLQLLRFIFPVATLSAFMSNTPIVATLMPVVKRWSKKRGISISKFLIPLSYATILGGMCTLIGTNANLIIHGFLIDSGYKNGLRFFELSPMGVPAAIVGLLYIAFVAYRFLPDRKEPIEQLGENVREFVVEMKIGHDFSNIGVSVEKAGLRHLQGLFLFQIERNGEIIAPIEPTEKLQLGDRLFFTGLPATILELQKTPGLSTIHDSTFDLKNYDSDVLQPFEVVVSASSPLVGMNIRESNFRSKYDAVILAIHRSGERINKKVGDIVVQPGDTMLILAEWNFDVKWYHSKDFYLVTSSENMPSKPHKQTWIALAVCLVFFLVMCLDIVPIVVASAIAAILLIATRCVSSTEAKNSIEWSVLMIIAASFGIGKAVEHSGVAAFVAQNMVSFLGSFGLIALLAGIYTITNLYSEIITNKAAIAVIFPIALAMSKTLGVSVLPFAVTIAVASHSFATPIGSQKNLMVYALGGYRYSDYVKAGLPLNIIVGLITVPIIYFIYF